MDATFPVTNSWLRSLQEETTALIGDCVLLQVQGPGPGMSTDELSSAASCRARVFEELDLLPVHMETHLERLPVTLHPWLERLMNAVAELFQEAGRHSWQGRVLDAGFAHRPNRRYPWKWCWMAIPLYPVTLTPHPVWRPMTVLGVTSLAAMTEKMVMSSRKQAPLGPRRIDPAGGNPIRLASRSQIDDMNPGFKKRG